MFGCHCLFATIGRWFSFDSMKETKSFEHYTRPCPREDCKDTREDCKDINHKDKTVTNIKVFCETTVTWTTLKLWKYMYTVVLDIAEANKMTNWSSTEEERAGVKQKLGAHWTNVSCNTM